MINYFLPYLYTVIVLKEAFFPLKFLELPSPNFHYSSALLFDDSGICEPFFPRVYGTSLSCLFTREKLMAVQVVA